MPAVLRPAPKPAAVVVATSKPPVIKLAQPAPVVVPTMPAAGLWRVQFGAFGVAANADALWAKLKVRPELTGHARINVQSGRVTKLQAGGYSEAAARSACSKLAANGFTCVAVKN